MLNMFLHEIALCTFVSKLNYFSIFKVISLIPLSHLFRRINFWFPFIFVTIFYFIFQVKTMYIQHKTTRQYCTLTSINNIVNKYSVAKNNFPFFQFGFVFLCKDKKKRKHIYPTISSERQLNEMKNHAWKWHES